MTSTPSKATAGHSAELLRLAERVEGLTAGDRAVADEILLACGWIADSNDEGEIAQWIDPSGASWSSFDLPDPTSSLDAAMSLVPEGWWWSGGVCKRENHASVGSEAGTFTDEIIFETFGANLALALCAAALRARAAAARGE